MLYEKNNFELHNPIYVVQKNLMRGESRESKMKTNLKFWDLSFY